ncbi:MAG: flagellar motor protein MotB [Bacteroidetes bacterium]|nr:MAG: flagellar motor protein MotB [Bacteroidota bacterium]
MCNKIKCLFILIVISTMFFSCVPTRQFQELKNKNETCVDERDSLKSNNESLTVKNTEQKSEIDELKKEIADLATKKSDMEDSLSFYSRKYKVYKKLYDDINTNQDKYSSSNDKETKLLLAEIQETKDDLQKREDKLKELELVLNAKQKELDAKNKSLMELDAELKQKQKELEEQNKKFIELQHILNRKDSAVAELKEKVTDALLGFENKGLSINVRNGKVYVSMEEKLLFKSGKYNVDTKGVNALKKLSTVLAQNKDINILVEGHTDDVPYHGTGNIKDNWDLSVMRATAIVKILLKNSKIEPKRITAAGRGKYVPIDPAKTSEARRKNRRTEIVLTPKLNELFQILENN